MLISCYCSFASTAETFSQDFAKTVQKQFKLNDIPGGAYVIVKENHVVSLKTLGTTVQKGNQPINRNTVFRLASVSKTFAAAITTKLAHENKLNLETPITDYVPYFQLAKKGFAEQIQLKHLLSHSSGLMPNTYDNMLHEKWPLEKVIKRFDKLNPICGVGKCYGYQNIAYSLVEPAIEHSQALSYEQLVNSQLFKPLDMKNASVGYKAFINSVNSAQPHILIKRKRTKQRDSFGDIISHNTWRKVKVSPDYYKVPSAAGINASISDMAKWLMANMGHSPEVLSPSLLDDMTTPRVKTKKDLRRKYWRNLLTDAHYGYGWRIYQLENFPIVYHSGWVAGFRAEVGYSPDLGIGFAMLINAESNVISKLSSHFWNNAEQLTPSTLNQLSKLNN
nr:serine hydrolase domain-containing protein [Marinifaba aquimaris]